MFDNVKDLAVPFLLVAFSLIGLELLALKKQKKQNYALKDTLCNLATLVIGRTSQPLFAAYIYLSLTAIEKFAPVHLPQTVAVTVLAVILTDLAYYWEHRLSHTNRYLWFFHEVHHSSKHFNLTTSFRLHWLGRIMTPLFFGPLILIGFRPKQVALFFILNLFYQFFLHTQMVGKIPLVEGVLNTPSAHRVHHARNKEYLNKNFGGIFIVWDRLFGTYEPEVAEPRFGIIGHFESNNPFTVQFHKLGAYRWLAAGCSAFVSKLRAQA